MPTGVSFSPRRIPNHCLIFKFRAGEPQHKITGILFIAVHLYPGSRLQVLSVEAGQFSVLRESIYAEIDVSPGLIGMTIPFNFLNQPNHIPDMIGGFTGNGGTTYIQIIDIQKESIRIELRNIPYGTPRFTGAFYHFILTLIRVIRQVAHISDIHYMLNFITYILQRAAQEVFRYVGSEISYMGIVIYGWAAGIHLRLTRFDSIKIFNFPCHGI